LVKTERRTGTLTQTKTIRRELFLQLRLQPTKFSLPLRKMRINTTRTKMTFLSSTEELAREETLRTTKRITTTKIMRIMIFEH
jgi:hypothetical protein